MDWLACICVGVHRMTASTSRIARLSASSVVTWAMPYLSATSQVLSRSRLMRLRHLHAGDVLDAVQVLDAEGAGTGEGDFDGHGWVRS
jgi:hypothetical protein